MLESGKLLKSLIEKSSYESNSSLARDLGLKDASVVSKWINGSQKIPHNRVYQLVDILNPNFDEVDILMGNSPLNYHFRTRNNRELQKYEISQGLDLRTRFLYEVIVENFSCELKLTFEEVQEAILNKSNKINDDTYKYIAESFREIFTVPDDSPLLADYIVDVIMPKIGVNSYFMPFDAIGLYKNCKEDNNDEQKSAVLFQKGIRYGILVDSNRNFASACFDLVHELIHIFIGDIYEKSKELEDLIDKTAGELIYPEKYLINLFMDGEKKSKIGKDPFLCASTFYAEMLRLDYQLAPKGLIKALEDYGMITKDHSLYEILNGPFQVSYERKAETMTSLGGIDIDFTNLSEHRDLFKELIDKKPSKYPLFISLKEGLVSKKISIDTYAKLFFMEKVDVMILLSEWSQNKSEEDSFLGL